MIQDQQESESLVDVTAVRLQCGAQTASSERAGFKSTLPCLCVHVCMSAAAMVTGSKLSSARKTQGDQGI